MKVELEITLGNDAMRTWDDIVEALRNLATRIESSRLYMGEPDTHEFLRVKDANGNVVGHLLISERGQ